MWFQGLAHFVKALTLPPPGTTAAAKTLALAIRTDAKIPEQTGHLRLLKIHATVSRLSWSSPFSVSCGCSPPS